MLVPISLSNAARSTQLATVPLTFRPTARPARVEDLIVVRGNGPAPRSGPVVSALLATGSSARSRIADL